MLELLLASFKHAVEALGLRNSARETVENETKRFHQVSLRDTAQRARYLPVLALGIALQFTLDHANHNLVADQTTLVHDLLRLPSKVGLFRDL